MNSLQQYMLGASSSLRAKITDEQYGKERYLCTKTILPAPDFDYWLLFRRTGLLGVGVLDDLNQEWYLLRYLSSHLRHLQLKKKKIFLPLDYLHSEQRMEKAGKCGTPGKMGCFAIFGSL
ncbi:hypothetical protein NE237_002059 [Protea cynaroides]|uniref:Uncharacterized protein n=1 Tax=Protea cynaroides TaxID=273540 RepID=A0A9Q0KU90_9MAGN|nr:hypothetical protein NE237_002059 [Protea cynaroides]